MPTRFHPGWSHEFWTRNSGTRNPRTRNHGTWLTARRVRAHGLLLAICLWTVYAVQMSAPGLLDRNGLVKGTDFLHFYTLGTLASQGRGDLLYDMRAQAELTRRLVPQAPDSLYVPLYGPQVSLLFEPFARLSYGWALAAWLAVNVLIFAFCCYAVWKTCPRLQESRWTVLVLILAIAFPGFFHLLAWGQTSGLALLCFTLAYLALRRRPAMACGIGHWIADLQTPVGYSRGHRVSVGGRVEGHRWRPGRRRNPACRSLDALWFRGHASLPACAHQCERNPAAARATALPDTLAALFLVAAVAVASGSVWLVRGQRPRRSGACSSCLAKWSISGGSLPGAIVRHRSRVPAFDRVRPGDSCAGVPAAQRLGPSHIAILRLRSFRYSMHATRCSCWGRWRGSSTCNCRWWR